MIKETIRCENCGVHFEPIKWNQKFCRAKCRFKSWEKLNPRTKIEIDSSLEVKN